jgi:DNA polymerase-3 subunit alpha
MTPIEIHTNYSIQNGFVHIPELVNLAVKKGIDTLSLTDNNSLSGVVEFLQEIEKSNSKNTHKIKPIIGSIVTTKYGDLLILCRNKRGYQNLLQILAKTNLDQDEFVHAIQKYLDENVIVIFKEFNLVNKEFFDKVPISFIYDQFCEYDIPKEKRVSYSPVFYLKPEDKQFYLMQLCMKYTCTMSELLNNQDMKILSETDMSLENCKSCENTNTIPSLIENFSITKKPEMLNYSSTPDDDLINLCRQGWKKRGLGRFPNLKDVYVNRIKMELDVFKSAGLANYMLPIYDITNFCRKNGQSCGVRGSAAGCLISYLIGISDVDPVQPDPLIPYSPDRELLFQRFYSAARNTETNISLPDIDLDVPPSFRSKLIEYIKNKYGKENVGYIITFSRLDGKGAIKEVFRILEPCANHFEIANNITKHMVDTAKVQDALEDLKSENPDYGIIQYNIDHIPKVTEFYKEYKDVFDVAIKLSSTIKNTGRHAAGIVISNEPLENNFPVTYDKNTGEKIVALEMVDLEFVGGVKYDILGVAAYEKIDKILEKINGRTRI